MDKRSGLLLGLARTRLTGRHGKLYQAELQDADRIFAKAAGSSASTSVRPSRRGLLAPGPLRSRSRNLGRPACRTASAARNARRSATGSAAGAGSRCGRTEKRPDARLDARRRRRTETCSCGSLPARTWTTASAAARRVARAVPGARQVPRAPRRLLEVRARHQRRDGALRRALPDPHSGSPTATTASGATRARGCNGDRGRARLAARARASFPSRGARIERRSSRRRCSS